MAQKPVSLANIVNATERILYGTRNFAAAAIAIGTTKSKVKTVNAINYCINGLMFAKAATDDLFVFTTVAPVQGLLTTCYYLLCLDASGASVVVNGTPMLTAAITATNYPAVPEIPLDANGIPTACPIGIVKVVCAAAATFTPGTTLLDAANVTATYKDVSCMPLNGGSF